MGFVVPQSGLSNEELERRIASLERELSQYNSVWVKVGKYGGTGKQNAEILSRTEIPTTDDSIYYEWKVSDGGADPAQKWNVKGGTFRGQGVTIIVPDGSVTGDEGYVFLHTVRDPSSRIVTACDFIFSSTYLDSDYNDQYRPLAYVNSAAEESIRQLQFEEIRILEDLIVANGEFKYAGLDLAHANLYDLPA